MNNFRVFYKKLERIAVYSYSEKCCFENFGKSTRKYPSWSLFLVKLQVSTQEIAMDMFLGILQNVHNS